VGDQAFLLCPLPIEITRKVVSFDDMLQGEQACCSIGHQFDMPLFEGARRNSPILSVRRVSGRWKNIMRHCRRSGNRSIQTARSVTHETQDQVAVITGGAQGIGQAVAEAFAAEGAKIVVSDINADLAQKTADEIAAKHGSKPCMRGDVSSVADCDTLMQAALDKFSRVDILVNNAGSPGTISSYG